MAKRHVPEKSNSEIPQKKNRYQKRDKQKKAKRKKSEKELLEDNGYQNFLETYLIPTKTSSRSSPHLIIRRQFHKIEDHSIILKKPCIIGEKNQRNISYEIEKIGRNVVTYGKSKYMNLDLSSTDGCKVFLLLHLRDTINIPHMCYFTERGESIDTNDLNHDLYGYVLLATIKLNQSWGKKPAMLDDNDYETVKKHRINQVKQNSTGYHFGTTGQIYSFGYTPTYSKNEITGHSIDRFAESKYILIFILYKFNAVY